MKITQMFSQGPNCRRYMDASRSTPYPHYINTVNEILKREIQCDTKTLGGGWIVIQVFHKD